MRSYPKWFYPLVLTCLIVLVVTGLLLIPTTLTMRFEWDAFWTLSGDNRLAAVASHTVISYLMLIIVGALSTIHMGEGVRRQKNQGSGFGLLVIFFTLMLTGIGLLYLASNTLIMLASTIHIFLGLLIAITFVLHVFNNKKTRRSAT